MEKILEAEQAVEPKTETYIETNLGIPSNSVSEVEGLLDKLCIRKILATVLTLLPGFKEHMVRTTSHYAPALLDTSELTTASQFRMS